MVFAEDDEMIETLGFRGLHEAFGDRVQIGSVRPDLLHGHAVRFQNGIELRRELARPGQIFGPPKNSVITGGDCMIVRLRMARNRDRSRPPGVGRRWSTDGRSGRRARRTQSEAARTAGLASGNATGIVLQQPAESLFADDVLRGERHCQWRSSAVERQVALGLVRTEFVVIVLK